MILRKNGFLHHKLIRRIHLMSESLVSSVTLLGLLPLELVVELISHSAV